MLPYSKQTENKDSRINSIKRLYHDRAIFYKQVEYIQQLTSH